MNNKSISTADYILLIALPLIPFITWHKIADGTLLSRQIYCLLITLLLTIYACIKTKTTKIFSAGHPYFIALFVWIGMYFASLLYAASFSEALYTASKVALNGSFIYVLATLWLNKKINLYVLSRAGGLLVLVSVLMLVYEASDQQQHGISLFKDKNLYLLNTVFGHKNLFSSAMLLCIPFVMHLILFHERWWRATGLILLLILLTSIALLQTKAVIAGLLLATLVCFIPFSKKLRPRFPKLYLLATGLMALLIAVFILIIYLYPRKFVLLSGNETLKERLLLWNNTIQMIKEFPLKGVGGGNWQIWFPKYGLQSFMQTNYLISDGYTTFQRPHNDLLWVWSETGPVGAIAWLFMFSYLLIKSFKCFKREPSLNKSLYFLTLFFTIVAYLVASLFDFPLERNEHQFLLGFIVAQVLVAGVAEHHTGNNAHLKPYLLIALALLAFSIVVALKRAPSEKSSLTIVKAHAVGNWDKIIVEVPRSVSIFYTLDNFSIPLYWYSGVAHYAKNEIDAAKTDFEKAYAINPYQVHVLNNIAGLYEKTGMHDSALYYYNMLLAISPTQPDAILNMSAVLFNEGKIKEAYESIYRFQYDAGNTQFTSFLTVMSKAYLPRLCEEKYSGNDMQRCQHKIEDEGYIHAFFKFNKAAGHSFHQLNFQPD